MRKRKRAFLVIISFSALILFLIWRQNHSFQRQHFLQGDSLSLLDHLEKDFVGQSRLLAPLRTIEKEQLNKGWQKLATFNGIVIWRTFATNPIIDNSADSFLRLMKDNLELKLESNLFQPDVGPDRWSFNQNQVYVTAPEGQPIDRQYYLTYQTFPGVELTKITDETLTNGQTMRRSKAARFRQMVYSLAHPLWIDSLSSAGIEVKKNGRIHSTKNWRWITRSEVSLYQASSVGILRMFSRSVKFQKRVFLPFGLASFQIAARAEPAGNDNPLLGIYMDGKRLGKIEIKDSHESEYQLEAITQEGEHEIRVVFENDYYNLEKDEDRNVNILKISINYKDAVILKTPKDDHARYSVSYTSSNSDDQGYYAKFVQERKSDNHWLNANSSRISIADELRNSLVLAPKDAVTFPVVVPNNGLLKLGYGFHFPQRKSACIGEIDMIVDRPFYSPKKLFTAISQQGGWKDETIDLEEFSGKKVTLRFEAKSADLNRACPFIGFISNPIIVDRQQPSQAFKHIFLISFDALRADHLGVYGYHRPTSPNIDIFARDAVVFENAVPAANWTLPSFTSLFTSMGPSFHNVTEGTRTVGSNVVTFPDLLRRRDYTNAAFVDSPFLFPTYGLFRGFDFYNYEVEDIEERVVPSLKWMERYGRLKHFLFVHLLSPHSPFTAPERYLQPFNAHKTGMMNTHLQNKIQAAAKRCKKPSPGELNDLLLLYDAEIRQLDEIFGRYINQMKKLKIYDEAMIILMSDHGEEFWDHGNLFHVNVYQETARVPLLIKFPKSYSSISQKRIPTTVHLTDLMPTLLELLNIGVTKRAQGLSLIKLLKDGQDPRFDHRTTFIESASGVLGIFNGDFKFIYSDKTHAWKPCGEMKQEEIYDLKKDPGERQDLSEQRKDLLNFFRKERSAYLEKARNFSKSQEGRKSVHTITIDQNAKEQLRALGYIQ